MRLLSTMTTDETCDVLCVCAPCIQSMADDKNLVKEMQRILPKGEHSRMDVQRFGLSRLAVLVPIILKDHRSDLYCILSQFNGKTEEECGKQNIMETLAEARELLSDKDFVDFFKSAFGVGQKV